MGKERIRELEATPPRRDAMQDIFAPLNAAANAQNLDLPILVYDAGAGVEIVSVKQKQGASLWAVRFGQNVLSKTGQWEWEPMPSNRNENFLSRCRFATAQEALECLAGAR